MVRTHRGRRSVGLSLTGLTQSQLDAVTNQVRSSATCLRARGRPWATSLRRSVLVVCASLRTNLTIRELAAVFHISKSQVQRIIADLVPRLAGLLASGTLGDVERGSSTAPSCRREITAAQRNPRIIVGPATYRCSRVTWIGASSPSAVAAQATATTPSNTAAPSSRPSVARTGACSQMRLSWNRGADHAVFCRGRIVRNGAWRRHRKRRARIEHTIARLENGVSYAITADAHAIWCSPLVPSPTCTMSLSNCGTALSTSR